MEILFLSRARDYRKLIKIKFYKRNFTRIAVILIRFDKRNGFFIRETKLRRLFICRERKLQIFTDLQVWNKNIDISIRNYDSESFAICKYLINRGFSNLSMIKIIYRIETKVVRVYQNYRFNESLIRACRYRTVKKRQLMNLAIPVSE